MNAIAKLKFFRMSPRRARLVADAIRGKGVEEAMQILEFMDNKPSIVLKKVLKSAVANAGNKEGMDTEGLYISKLLINAGPVYKRHMPRAMGRATVIRKTTSHVDLTVADGAKPGKRKGKKTSSVKAKESSKKVSLKKKTVKKKKSVSEKKQKVTKKTKSENKQKSKKTEDK
ncbi:MAG: 50S ribosomal protein L22 [Candidatus Aureabacteria bacterium]|nr:50S ribosomal protein L22 [Candidatus Auribacterota bacterium]